MGNIASDRKNARCYSLKLSRNTDSDIIGKLDRVDSIQGYIKSLIRADMKKEEEKTMKRISIDNGANYITPAEAVEKMPWEIIVNAMDDETREKVHADGCETELDFLTEYLKLAEEDLIIG